MAKAANIRKITDESDTVSIMWDLAENNGTVIVPDLITLEANFDAESKQVIASFIKDTVPAGETP